jgi:hypothetical protein
MADKQFLTLLDLTATTGTDTAVGVVKVIMVHAPELSLFSGRPINGTTYEVTRARALPGGSAFRAVNAPVLATAGKYEKILGQCFRIDRPVQIDQALVEAQMATYGGVAENFQAAQVEQQMQALGILLGQQFYYGTTIDANGYDGLKDFVDNSPFTCIDAGGTVASTLSSAWIVYNHPQGVHWTYGAGKGLSSGVWMPQQVTAYMSGTSGALGIKPMYVNNIFGWLGLQNNSPLTRTNKTDLISVVRIANIGAFSTGKHLTDALVARAKKLFPLSISSNPGELRLMMSRRTNLDLALSRMVLPTTTASSSLSVAGPMQFTDAATASCGIPISETDSILDTESAITIV